MTPQENSRTTPPIGRAYILPLPVLSHNEGFFGQFRVVNLPAEPLLEEKPAEMAISDFYKHHGYKALVHQCIHWVNAVSILKTGNLAPYGNYKDQIPGFAHHANTKYVYFRAEYREQSPDSVGFHSVGYSSCASEGSQGDLDMLTFVHDLSLLDNHSFYTGSMYGEPTAETFSTVPSLPLCNPLTEELLDREILVQGKVPNHSLTAIWVHPLRRDEFLTRFRLAGIDSVDGLPLARFINPSKLLPRRLEPTLADNDASANPGIRTGQNLSITGH